jgi:hypothetical protein
MKASSYVLFLVLLLVSATQAADSLNVRMIGSCDTPAPAHGVAVRGDYAFVADWSSGLRVISVADPAHPIEVGHADVPDSAVAVAVSGNYAYVVGMQAGLRVISVADPTNPTEVGYYDPPGLTTSVAVNGNYAYVADVDSGLWVISISDPAHPTKVGRWQSPYMAFGITAAGHFVYVNDAFYGLRVVSVTDPANPHEVGYNESLGFGGVAVNGGYAYVGRNQSGLFVVSLADSTHPAEVGWCDTHEPILSVAVDDYAYTTGGSWLEVFSVSDPAHPDTVGHYYSAYWETYGLASSGDCIYVATDSGLSVCQRYDAGVEEATNAELRATECEPTVVRGALVLPRDMTEIRSGISDRVPRPSLLDISGRNVLDLHPGPNDVSVLAPGVYFVSERQAGSVRRVIVAR